MDTPSPVTDETAEFKRWQRRIFSSVWITYFAFYLCRYNMPMAKSRLSDTFDWDSGQVGMIFTALTMMYAVGQFVNGQLTDRFGTRTIASVGVVGSVLVNVAVFVVTSLTSMQDSGLTLTLIVLLWGANGFLQAMGWPSMVRVMTHWFPTRTRGKIMGWLGTCYQFGGAVAWFLAFMLTGYFVEAYGIDWRAVFWVPAAIFAVVGIIFYWAIRNEPQDVGLPPIDAEDEPEAEADAGPRRTIGQNILATISNPYIWVVAGTFFLLDVNRYGFVNWLPAFLDEAGGDDKLALLSMKDVMKRIIHPLTGAAGAVLAGWATDRFFGGRRAPMIALLLGVLGLSSIVFPYIDPTNTGLVIVVLGVVGFCTYGPHILMVGHAAQDFGKKHGSGGAAGFIDGMGYIGASLAGWGAGELIDLYNTTAAPLRGYKVTFTIFGFAALLGVLLISIIWKVNPTEGKGDVEDGEAEGNG